MASRLTVEQVRTILTAAHRLPMGATYSRIARETGDATIERWNVRDVLAHGCGVRRLSALTTDTMTAHYALGA
jgi:hypothetical protein